MQNKSTKKYDRGCSASYRLITDKVSCTVSDCAWLKNTVACNVRLEIVRMRFQDAMLLSRAFDLNRASGGLTEAPAGASFM
jgi:hypothetical protein